MANQQHDADRSLETSRGVYGITVASDLVGTGVQNLRAYEKAGLLDPSRTAGGTRLYSARIHRLLQEGLNLAGIARVLDLEDDNEELRTRLAEHEPDTGAPD